MEAKLSSGFPAFPFWKRKVPVNNRQKGVLVLWAAFFVLMGLYPPWLEEEVQSAKGGSSWAYSSTVNTSVVESAVVRKSVAKLDGYNWIFSAEPYNVGNFTIDLVRLCVQWVVLSVGMGTWFYLMKFYPGTSARDKPAG